MTSPHPLAASALFDVSGLVVLVTGAASGIGFGIAEVMAANGARVTLVDRDAAALEDATRRLADQGGDVIAALADVTDADALKRAFATTAETRGRIDIVFANAGISGGPGFLRTDMTRNADTAFENIPRDLWDRVMATNVTALFSTIQIAIPHLERQGGRIIVTSSISARLTELHVGAAYVTSKAAVGHLVRQAAIELAGRNIRVNAISPGPVITNIGGGRLKDAATRAPFEQMAPLHAIATPADLQGAALFLASPAARHMTGAEIVVDGGRSLGTAD